MRNVKKKKMFIINIFGMLVLIAICLGFYCYLKRPSSDGLKFKEEYEKLNNTIRELDGNAYNNVSIAKNNPIKYVDIREAIEIIKNESAVIYIGANWCPWCRNAIPVLFESAKRNKVKTVYYLNIDDDKSKFEIQNKKLVQTKEGTSEYYELLDLLSDTLKEYVLTDSDGRQYKTNERRIYMPTVITVKYGTVLDMHVGTVSLNDNQTKYSSLTEEQHNELLNIYDGMLTKIK